MSDYLPEGLRIGREENLAYLKNLQTLQEAQRLGKILEARAVVCDSAHNLQVDLGWTRGWMPKEECALGIQEGYIPQAGAGTVPKTISFPPGAWGYY